MALQRLSPGVYRDTNTGKTVYSNDGKTSSSSPAAAKKAKNGGQIKAAQANLAGRGTVGSVGTTAIADIGKNIVQSGYDTPFNSNAPKRKFTGTDPNESGNTQSVIDSAFGQLTQTTERDYNAEKAALEQKLYNQGIQYNADPNSQYQQQTRDLDQRYDSIRSDARQKAVLTGSQQYNDLVNNERGIIADTSAINTNDYNTNLGGLGALSSIQDRLIQQGFDKRKVEAIFKQLAQSGRRSGGGGTTGPSSVFDSGA